MKECKDERAWSNGECCCNCANQITLYMHPWNKNTKIKGQISKPTGLYACLAMLMLDKTRNGIIFDREHGYCELYVKEEELLKPKYSLERVKELLAEQRHNCQVEMDKRSIMNETGCYLHHEDVMNAKEPDLDS